MEGGPCGLLRTSGRPTVPTLVMDRPKLPMSMVFRSKDTCACKPLMHSVQMIPSQIFMLTCIMTAKIREAGGLGIPSLWFMVCGLLPGRPRQSRAPASGTPSLPTGRQAFFPSPLLPCLPAGLLPYTPRDYRFHSCSADCCKRQPASGPRLHTMSMMLRLGRKPCLSSKT